jgi:hypothetical protein
VPFRRVATGKAIVRRPDSRLRSLRKAKADKPEQDHCEYDISIFDMLVLFHCFGPSLIWVFTQVLQKIWRDITRKVFLRRQPLQFTLGTFADGRGFLGSHD